MAEPIDLSQLEIIDDQTADYLRSIGGTGRLAIMNEIDRAARAYVTANVRRQHPTGIVLA